MKPRSQSLFHFTDSAENLQRILLEGFWPRYCLEDIEWHGDFDDTFVAFPMVCFCDIPLSRIDEHVAFYGNFGIGMSKDWAAKNRLSPVLYFAAQTEPMAAFLEIARTAEAASPKKQKALFGQLRRLAAHIKPITGNVAVSGTPTPKDFYQESEWRYVPAKVGVPDFLAADDFGDKKRRTAANLKTKQHCMLRFSPSDIRYLFVPSDGEIPALMDFIQTKLDKHASADLKVLMSRVTSLDSVRADL